MVCEGCGRDEAVCTCTAASNLMHFLSDFRGRPEGADRRAAARAVAVGQVAEVGATGQTGATSCDDDPGSSAPMVVSRFVPPSGTPVPVPETSAAPDSAPVAPRPAPVRPRKLPGSGLLDFSGSNVMATASVVLAGLTLLMPLFAVGAIAAAVITLRRTKEAPWLRGKARAITAIAASIVTAALSLAIWIPILLGN